MTQRQIQVNCPECGQSVLFDESEDYRTCICGALVRREEGRESSVTIAVRTDPYVKAFHERRAKAFGLTFSEHMRRILNESMSKDKQQTLINARKQPEQSSSDGRTCPIVEMLRNRQFCPHIRRDILVSDVTVTCEQEDMHSTNSDDPFERLFRELSDDRSASCTPKGEAHMPGAEHANTKRVKVER